MLLDEILGDSHTNRRRCLVIAGDQLDLHSEHTAGFIDLGNRELRASQHVLTVGGLSTRQGALKGEGQGVCAWCQRPCGSDRNGNRSDRDSQK